MVRSNMKRLALMGAVLGMLTASEAMAADITDVLDAADEVYLGSEKVSDPFDISLTPKFSQHYQWAKIKHDYYDTTEKRTRSLNELKYERVINKMDIALEIGMYHDLSFRMNVPVIISDQQKYKFDSMTMNVYDEDGNHIATYDTQVSPDRVDRLDNKGVYEFGGSSYFAGTGLSSGGNKFFNLQDNAWLNGRERAGLGDISFGIAWSPYNTERHFIPERPWEHNTGRSTVTLAFDYVAPTGSTMGIDNDAVGSGVHELIFTVASSHRFAFVDPYIRLQYGLPIATDDYKDYGSNQPRKSPGMWGRVDLGVEFIPYESIDVKFQRNVKIDLRGYFKYTGEGRRYSELADAFGTSDCMRVTSTNGELDRPECAWVASKWSNATSIKNGDYSTLASGKYTGDFQEDGIFDYEGYATVGGALNLTITPVQYVSIIAGVAADYTQNHYITFTKAGKDRGTYTAEASKAGEKDGIVNTASTAERNPAYSDVLDGPGNRSKLTENLNLEWFVGLKLMY